MAWSADGERDGNGTASRASSSVTAGGEGTREPGRSKPEPGLSLVSTPIGNLRDITLRALDTLAGADLLLCEDTRVTGRLLDAYGLRVPMQPYHEHNADKVRPKVLDRLRAGAAVALVSDAGTPLVSDPGFRLVGACAAEGLPVQPIPGPAAPLAFVALQTVQVVVAPIPGQLLGGVAGYLFGTVLPTLLGYSGVA